MPDIQRIPARDAASRIATCKITSTIDIPDVGLLRMRSSAASPNIGYATIALAAMGAQLILTDAILSSSKTVFRPRRPS